MTTHTAGPQNGTICVVGREHRRAFLSAALMLVVLAVAGTAVAYWGTAGVGAGTAATDTGLPVTIDPGTPSAQLFPGGQADVVQTISNPNPYDVHIDSLSLDASLGAGGYAVDAQHTDCVLTTLTFTLQTNGGNGWTVPAAVEGVAGSLPLTLTDALGMGTGAANACQGATFTVYLRADS